MMKRILLASTLSCGALLSGYISPARANLITNGTFSDPNVGPGWSTYSSITGWTVNHDVIEIDNSSVVMSSFYNNVAQSLEVNANTFDTVSQTVTGLTVGANYSLTWGYGDRSGSGPQRLDVSFGGSAVASDYGTGSGNWTTNSFTVTANATSEILSFAAIDVRGSPSVGNEISDVSLVAVPEPASMALLGAGLVGLGVIRRHRA